MPKHFLANFGNNPLASCIKGEATLKGIRSLLAPYAVALLAVGSGLLLTLLLQPLLKPTIFLLFFAAVAISAWYGGIEAGLLATTLSTLAVSYFFLEPVFSLMVGSLDSIRRLGLFVLVTTFITLLNSELRTAKQHLQTSLQKRQVSEARFRRLVESNIIGVIVANMDGAIAEANDVFLEMVGYSREDLLAGRVRWRDMIPPEYIEANNSAITELKTKGVCQPFENQYIRKDNSRVPILLGCALLENTPEDVICFVLDLSQGKQVEAALRQRENELRLITNAVPVNISYVDSKQHYRFNNKGYEDWFGLPASEISGKHIREVLGESVYQSILPYVETVLSGEQVTYETQLSDKDGKNHYVNVTYVPQFSQQEKVEGFVVLSTDITLHKLAEQERERLLEREQAARADAETANRMKDEFLATLSHELRTPLNAILGWSQLLRKRKLDENLTGRALETIERNSRSLTQLIEDVLDVSRIIRGTLHLSMEQVKLVTLIEAAIDTVYPAAQAKEISIKCRFDPEVEVVVGDVNRLQQVVWNLLSNAVKFTPKGGRVDVQLERIESCVQIQVSDTGGGIAAEFLPHVFERFRQADSSTTRSHGGLGLGLAIVRHLVELHGGTVCAKSPGIGQGATFVVSLPMKTI
ncbi:MAG: ATP-binding protein [Nostoc sp.]|uniref:sensor histidine kinase n=1 Tax=Nostoc sp. TaxID=1180 RepID=UPI002FF563CB